jgi:hypothetical protein
MRIATARPRSHRRLLAQYLAPATASLATSGATKGPAQRVLVLNNRVADAIVTRELAAIVDRDRELARRVEVLRAATDKPARKAATAAVAGRLERALRYRPELVDALWPLLDAAEKVPCPNDDDSDADGEDTRRSRWVLPAARRAVAWALLAGSIAAVLIVALWAGDRRAGSLGVGELAVIAMLSFLPGWLYIRFIGQRAGAIWDEYVLNLHRLKLDHPQFLPQPPRNSEYFEAWFEGGGAMLSGHRNIYRQKFEAHFGRSAAEVGPGARIRTETLFPIVLGTVIFAIGWTALLWDGAFTEPPAGTLDILAFGFLGAYLFDIQMLARRFFQSDLKPSAYASAVLRVIIVLILVLVMHQLGELAGGDRAKEEAVVAFVVGLFPLVGLRALNRVAAKLLRGSVPTLDSKYPLSDLDGMNVWYEARLLEEGIEDVQNLVTASMVEVLLHTRVSVARLVDWHDQAQLFLHLRPRSEEDKRRDHPRSDEDKRREHPRDTLAAIGVRSATAFLEMFPVTAVNDRGEWTDPRAERAFNALGPPPGNELSADAVMAIARVLHAERGLDPVKSWRDWMNPATDERAPEQLRAKLHAA